jgi:photosystem II stability/assembly factor-like uncharacterized protein
MTRTDDPLDLMNALRPAMLDELADEGYARRRRGDLARAAAETQAERPPVCGRRWPTFGPGRPRRSPRPGRVPTAIAAAIVTAALLVLAVQAGPWHQRGPGHGAQRSVTSPRMRLVASVPSSFRSSGVGPQADSLDCVTGSVCYVWDSGSEGHGAERTTDGGATWHPLAALPGGRSLSGQNAGPPSCPTAEVCVGPAGGLTLAVTTDGGARWRIESLPAPQGKPGASIDEVSCPTAADCVVHVTAGGTGTFLSTTDAGRTWTQAASVPRDAPASVWYLRCGADGRCIALTPTGTNTKGGIVAMRSADNGRTWAVSANQPAPATDIFMVSCGDALHCMEVSDGGATMTTSDGGVTWQDTTPVSTRPGTPLTVSCAAGLDCFVAVSRWSATVPDAFGPGGDERATIEVTHDGAAAWSRISLPTVAGTPLAEVFPLSCPSQAGCIAVAATPQQANGADPQREIISSFPARGGAVTGG